MTDHTDIGQRLEKDKWHITAVDAEDAIAEITRLRAEAAELRSVMIAAAEEIQAHWPAHCDAEGYGPANLMRRLEDGIPSQYAYTAGDFERLRAEAEALRKALIGLDEAYCRADSPLSREERHEDRMRLIAARAAIDATKGTT